MMEIKQVSFSYFKKGPVVLNDFSLTLKEGEIVALLGTNGIGKSTAMRLLSGLLKPQSGEILFEGNPLSKMSDGERARKIAYLPQRSELPDLPVEEAVLLGRLPHYYLYPSLEDRRIATEAMEEVGIAHLAGRYVSTLSGGEQELVSIARALADQPSVLLMDEPTASLDPAHRQSVHRLIKKAAEKGMAVLLSLHDIDEALRLADRLLFLEDGRIAYSAAPEELSEEMLKKIYGVDMKIIEIDGNKAVIEERI